MKISKIGFFCILVLIQIISSCREKHESDDLKMNNPKEEFPEKEVKGMIKEFYKAYISQSLDSTSPKKNSARLDSITKIYCTKSLLDSINKEFTTYDLDYDPFLRAQDSDPAMLDFIIEKMEKKENVYRIMFLSYQYDSSFEMITFKVTKDDGKYMISSMK